MAALGFSGGSLVLVALNSWAVTGNLIVGTVSDLDPSLQSGTHERICSLFTGHLFMYLFHAGSVSYVQPARDSRLLLPWLHCYNSPKNLLLH